MQEGNTGEDSLDDGSGSGTRSYGSHAAMIPLSDRFTPGEYDVMVGRGKICRNHPGNARFRDLVASLLDEYSGATSKLEKSAIVQRVLIEVRTKTPNGGFIKKDPLTGQWYEVGDFVARERVTQCFRDALHGKYRSSNTSKKQRRKEELKKAKEAPPAKKAKEATGQSRMRMGDLETQPTMGMHISTGFPSSLTVENRSGIFNHQLNRSQQAAFSAHPVANSFMSPLAGEALGSAAGLPLAGPNLEQQVMALRHQSQSVASYLSPQRDQQSIQESSYPNSWFRVNSGELLSQNLMNDLSIPGVPYVARLGAPAANDLVNQSLGQSNQVDTGRMNGGASLEAVIPGISFSGFSGDDNPFEPVPIAESISRQNAENKSRRQPHKGDEEV